MDEKQVWTGKDGGGIIIIPDNSTYLRKQKRYY